MIFSCFVASTVKCQKPQPPANGIYEPEGRTVFKLNEVITVVCDNHYYPWGEETKKCCGLEDGDSAWLPTTSRCSDLPSKDSRSRDSVTECLSSAQYYDKCKESGSHGVLLNDEMFCKGNTYCKIQGYCLVPAWLLL